MGRYLLAHDLGTSGNKAVLFDADKLEIAGDCTVAYPTEYPAGGLAEHCSENWWNAVCVSTKNLLEKTGVGAKDIAAVSFSAIMNTCLPVDKAGNPLCNAFIWADQRGASEADRLLDFAGADELYRLTGHRINGTYAVSKMMWLRRHRPDIFGKTAFFLQAKDYIIFRLTGRFVSDYTDASHLGIFDQNAKKYCVPLIEAAGLSCGQFPELIVSTDTAGYVTKEAAGQCGLCEGTPVVAGGGDGCCATAGAGVYEKGQGYATVGTSAWAACLNDRPLIDSEKVAFTFVYLDGERYLNVGTMQSAGHSYSQMMERFYPGLRDSGAQCYEEADRKIAALLDAEKVPPLLYLPYPMGERSPWWNSSARGCVIGIDAGTTRFDLLRACLEGVAFNLYLIIRSLEKNCGALDMRLIGGGARTEAWLTIFASVWGKELIIPRYLTQAASLGAVICAGIGAGIFQGFDIIRDINPVQRTVSVRPGLQKQYARLAPVFEQSYRALVPVFDSLASYAACTE